jgi:hypothetical protein
MDRLACMLDDSQAPVLITNSVPARFGSEKRGVVLDSTQVLKGKPGKLIADMTPTTLLTLSIHRVRRANRAVLLFIAGW